MSKSIILIVDPKEVLRGALRRALDPDSTDYEILEAGSGPEALALLRARSVDLIIAEYVLPGDMDGLEFLRRVRDELQHDALRIVLTHHGDLDIALEAINQGAVYRYLLKPWAGRDLRVTMKLAVQHLATVRETARLARSGSS